MSETVIMWGSFFVLVLGLLAIDFFVVQRHAHAMSTREALAWTGIWISLGLAFNVFVYFERGPTAGLEFLTGFVIEKALSIDNLFVFLVIFRYFAVPAHLQHRVLFYGILGAMIMRGIFIALGSILIEQFHWVIYVFGFFLLYTAWRLWSERGEEFQVESNRVVVWGRKYLPMTDSYIGQNFVIRRGNRWLATPLLLVLITVEFTDLVFAVDSIPAIFGITTDPFIVFTSNIFAIAGLRALYFVLQGMYDKFDYLKEGLALVLGFVGLKMLIEDPLNALAGLHIPVTVSLVVVAGLITGSIVLSLLRPRPPEEIVPEPPEEPPFSPGPPIE